MALQGKDWRASLKAMFHQADFFGLLIHSVLYLSLPPDLHDCFRYGAALLYDENPQCK
jgi:hypothetical protein